MQLHRFLYLHRTELRHQWRSVIFFSSEFAARGSARPSNVAAGSHRHRGNMGSFRAALRLSPGKNEAELYLTCFPVVL